MVQQIAFDIPEEIMNEIKSGALIRIGGIVRDKAGHIVKHLEEIPISNTKVQNILKVLKKNKLVIFGGVLAVTIVGIAGIKYYIVKNNKNEKIKIPKCVVDFNEAFMNYINAIQNGKVSEDIINEVISKIGEIEKIQENGKEDIDFSIENANLLLNIVSDYTQKLAEVNDYDILNEKYEMKNDIVDLQHYLMIQKQIFEKCS